MKRATATDLYPVTRPIPFEIVPAHRNRPGWRDMWDRLTRPLSPEREAEIAALYPDSDAEPAEESA